MIVFNILGYLCRNKQNSYAALIYTCIVFVVTNMYKIVFVSCQIVSTQNTVSQILFLLFF